jgi:cytosine/adenosine deaminase-related metal-dependent hydrolase
VSSSFDFSTALIVRAPWVVPVTSPVLVDGAVLIRDNRIHAMGPSKKISKEYPNTPVRRYRGVLMPGLVNAHMHLELSVFGTIKPENENSTMCEWIRALLKKRMAATFTGTEIFTAAEKVVQEQYASGVVLLLDIGNTRLSGFLNPKPEIFSLLEMLGPTKDATAQAVQILGELSKDVQVTGHAPYSTSPQLLQCLKKRSLQQKGLFSLHVAENKDESLFLLEGGGCFVDFLQDRGALDGTFPLLKNENLSVVDYLNKSGILDKKSICVHCVHVSVDEIQILAQSQCHVCLCPGSNRFLQVGKAPLEQILEHGIVPALGTDSIASNPVLDMWREMALLRQEYPEVAAEKVLQMATLAGAKALHRDVDYGSLATGKSANFIAVQDAMFANVKNENQLLDRLTTLGRPESVDRVLAI